MNSPSLTKIRNQKNSTITDFLHEIILNHKENQCSIENDALYVEPNLPVVDEDNSSYNNYLSRLQESVNQLEMSLLQPGLLLNAVQSYCHFLVSHWPAIVANITEATQAQFEKLQILVRRGVKSIKTVALEYRFNSNLQVATMECVRCVATLGIDFCQYLESKSFGQLAVEAISLHPFNPAISSAGRQIIELLRTSNENRAPSKLLREGDFSHSTRQRMDSTSSLDKYNRSSAMRKSKKGPQLSMTTSKNIRRPICTETGKPQLYVKATIRKNSDAFKVHSNIEVCEARPSTADVNRSSEHKHESKKAIRRNSNSPRPSSSIGSLSAHRQKMMLGPRVSNAKLLNDVNHVVHNQRQTIQKEKKSQGQPSICKNNSLLSRWATSPLQPVCPKKHSSKKPLKLNGVQPTVFASSEKIKNDPNDCKNSSEMDMPKNMKTTDRIVTPKYRSQSSRSLKHSLTTQTRGNTTKAPIQDVAPSLAQDANVHKSNQSPHDEQGSSSGKRSEETTANLLRRYYEEGLRLQQAGKLVEAIEAYNLALQHDGDGLASLHLNRGGAYLQLHQLTKAKKAFIAALRIQPENAKALYNLGITHVQLKEWEDAENQFLNVIKIQPHHKKASVGLKLVRSNM